MLIATVEIYSYTFRFDINTVWLPPQCINGSHTEQKLHRKLFINPANPSSSFLCAVLSLDVCPLDYPCERLLGTVLLVPVTLLCPVPVTGGAKTSTPGILKLGRRKKEEEKEPECCKIKAPQSFKALPGVNILWIPKAFFFSFSFFLSHTSLPCKLPLTSTPNVPPFYQLNLLSFVPVLPRPLLSSSWV